MGWLLIEIDAGQLINPQGPLLALTLESVMPVCLGQVPVNLGQLCSFSRNVDLATTRLGEGRSNQTHLGGRSHGWAAGKPCPGRLPLEQSQDI
jgi:hypothetical protein